MEAASSTSCMPRHSTVWVSTERASGQPSEAQETLDTVKQLLKKASILVPPTDGEPLLLYIAATTQVVSVVLVVEREEKGHVLKVQCSVYFISEVLSNSKTRYP